MKVLKYDVVHQNRPHSFSHATLLCKRRLYTRPLRPLYRLRCAQSRPEQETTQEQFVEEFTATFTPTTDNTSPAAIDEITLNLSTAQAEIDNAYEKLFSDRVVEVEETNEIVDLGKMDSESFSKLGKERPDVMKALLHSISQESSEAWYHFQERVQALKLKQSRLRRQLDDARDAMAWQQRQRRTPETPPVSIQTEGHIHIVLITGFESFNSDLYSRVAKTVSKKLKDVSMSVFSDRDITERPTGVEAALKSAAVLFVSLVVDYEEATWLRDRCGDIPTRFIFESAIELMSLTNVGTFNMASTGKSKGAPPAVRKLLSLFGSKREEDRMLGYLSFLKIGPKILKFIPGSRAHDLQTWLMVYNYWTQSGSKNIENMIGYMIDRIRGTTAAVYDAPIETPNTGCVHPNHQGYFTSPKEYLEWYAKDGPVKGDAPVVALLLYRKHVITGQSYIYELIRLFEADGLKPLPVFITGVEAHTVVRDLLTSRTEQQQIMDGVQERDSLKRDAVPVEAVVNTIGFPLVGGPAGSLEAGRQADIAQAILTAKNIPYFVAAPLLVQNLESWMTDGIAGLQSVVLYSLPELDGSVDTVPLGGLVGDHIMLIPERVKKLTARVKRWIKLRTRPVRDRKLAILLYGFPPGVGAIGTAALLNVPKSLQSLLLRLKREGYDVGDMAEGLNGEALLEVLKAQLEQGVIYRGGEVAEKTVVGAAASSGVAISIKEITPGTLRDSLTYPPEWGPTEWGPIPFLPDNDILVQRLEKQWGDVNTYKWLSTSARGNLVVSGIQFGNVWIGVQPLLGVEGDPMRLLFERDLTPHPQYCAFYKWLQKDFNADAVLHFGMHGTVEWLPGAPLGNTGLSWSDVLMGDMPNIYIYACNNPSESIIAKRRGYGTIVSHNVPPYGRAGLYKQLAELKSLLDELRDDQNGASSHALREALVSLLQTSGLNEDCPFIHPDSEKAKDFHLTVETVDQLSTEMFEDYASELYQYLMSLENRLYSEGLHVLGAVPTSDVIAGYLEAYFGEELPNELISRISANGVTAERLATDEEQLKKIRHAIEIRDLLRLNTQEMDSIIQALNGEYVRPAPGGDLLRDGAGVLPTGRNIYALDPYRMPGPAAMERDTAYICTGKKVAEKILEQHLERNGTLPETVAVNLWGLDSIKTKGESIGVVLALVGAEPLQDGGGRIARYNLIPLEKMHRPRIDCLCHMSGIFRDSFQNVVELLDDLFKRAAQIEELSKQNYIRKHALEMGEDGIDGASARLFSNPAGDFGSMVNERVGASDWAQNQELGSTWASRYAFSYGRNEKGAARPEVLQKLLKSTSHIIQEIDSVEYGLTDIQEYYANTGGLVRAVRNVRGDETVECSVVETFSKEIQPQSLDQVLRMEYRTKLLNPRWAKAMAEQGSGGAYEISQRMTAMVGWGATTDFSEDWSWEQAADTYAFDPEMAEKLRQSNPEAFRNTVRRMIEAAGRGFWKADASQLSKLKELYTDIEDRLEGV